VASQASANSGNIIIRNAMELCLCLMNELARALSV
jgi:hypothetical protein